MRKWCFYKISLVCLLFQQELTFSTISLGPINMFLGTFQSVYKELQKIGPNKFTLTSLFAVFTSWKWEDQTTGSVFCSLGLAWLWSFSSYETGLPNTNHQKCLILIFFAVPVVGQWMEWDDSHMGQQQKEQQFKMPFGNLKYQRQKMDEKNGNTSKMDTPTIFEKMMFFSLFPSHFCPHFLSHFSERLK